MLTVVIKKSDDLDASQMTQKTILKELWAIPESEMLLEDSWLQGLKKVRTPFVCLVEADCILSASYIASNFNLLRKSQSQALGGKGTGRGMGGGGLMKLAVLSSCLGIKDFSNRIYNYRLAKVEDGPSMKGWHIQPQRESRDIHLYMVQVGFIPGAIMRMSSIKDSIETLDWDQPDLVKMSTEVCFHLWGTNRRVALNPSTTYVTDTIGLDNPPLFSVKISTVVANTFNKEYL